MALRATIDLDTPDFINSIDADVTSFERGTWDFTVDPPTYTKKGIMRTTVSKTVKKWVANTMAACKAAKAAYSGTGAVRIVLRNQIIKNYDLEITESETTNEWVPAED